MNVAVRPDAGSSVLLDGPAIAALNADGFTVAPRVLSNAQCRQVADYYAHDECFRSRIVMARHGFGRGEYRYFSYPLPPAVAALRATLYDALVDVANEWYQRMSIATRFPATHDQFLECCRRAGQTRPTPLLLSYVAGDYNCLHQDLYGEQAFPLQMAVLLSAPGEEFSGGEFVLTEQRPRMQSRVHVVPLRRGDAVIFAVNQRPMRGVRGDYRVTMRHGVSRILHGTRQALGIILHDAA